ncbi:MAG TPA: sigma-70 family RNA polymerase sigma factor [Pirellulales bacterium]|jgi:RNA polymerase sigma-70 factor (ECF subfamily)|nr:sigma-70 family RNA polymerase sigma factor [Pirellulales bacterium]
MTQTTSEAGKNASASPVSVDWSALLAQHDRWLRTIALARVGEAQAVDEVMQEVALAAVRQRSPLADPAKAAPWLYRLTVMQALLYRRRIGRRRKLTSGYAERVRPSESDSRTYDPLGWLLADETRKLVRVALGRLPRRDAEILLLKYTEDWSYHEIAAHLGIGHSAVEARLHRARRRLRSELAALDVVEKVESR